jgi:hypothetical protein
MAKPTLAPASTVSNVVLSATGSINDVTQSLVFGIYSDSGAFLSGAADQVAYTYKKLGGDVLDIELAASQVYAAYEEATLEYSYIVNIHQSKNILSNVLGGTTGSFDHDGNIISGDSLENKNIALRYPKFDFAYARRIAEGISSEAGVGGSTRIYSASFDSIAGQQDYDLQDLVASASLTAGVDFSGSVANKKILVRQVFYTTPRAAWRFFGYYGGINVIGSLSTYGQWADDSTFQIVPVWQNKIQAQSYQDAIYTRLSHYSYELVNNRLRLFPAPSTYSPEKFWFRFSIPSDTWEEENDDVDTGILGISNMSNLPFENIPYASINSIGKQWIRRFGLALCKEMLGNIRSKFATIPIPGNEVTLNGPELLSQAKEEQEMLRTELKEVLDELTYGKLIEGDASLAENAQSIFERVPLVIYRG